MGNHVFKPSFRNLHLSHLFRSLLYLYFPHLFMNPNYVWYGPRRKVLRNPNNLPYIYFFPWYNWNMNHPFHCLKLLIFPSKQREIFFVYTARKGLNLRYNQTPTSFLPNKIVGLIRKIRIKHHWLLQFCFCFFLLIEKRYHSFMLVSHF